MKKEITVLTFMVLVLLVSLFSIDVHAVGLSTGGDTENAVGQSTSSTVNCEAISLADREARIKCRLQNKERVEVNEQSKVPEACRRLTLTATANQISKEGCTQVLY